MLTRKRPLSRNDDRANQRFRPEAVYHSPEVFTSIHNNTPETSPHHQNEADYISSIPPTACFSSEIFHNDLLKAFVNKLPGNVNKESIQNGWMSSPKDVPSISVAHSSPVSNSNASKLSIENLEKYNFLSLAKSMENMEIDQNSSFDDHLSTLAACASDCSDLGSLSDVDNFEFEDKSQPNCSIENLFEFVKPVNEVNFSIGKPLRKSNSCDDLSTKSCCGPPEFHLTVEF